LFSATFINYSFNQININYSILEVIRDPMASTDPQPDLAATVLSGVQRRKQQEKRKQRIMEKGGQRMAAILSIDGQMRQPPCIDGASSITGDSGPQSATEESITEKCAKSQNTSKMLDFLDETPTTAEEIVISSNKPKYIEFVDKTRIWIAISMGVVLALCTLFCDRIGNVILPIFLLVAAYEAVVFQTKKLLYPRNKFIVDAISAAGINGDVLMTIGLILEILWGIGIDTLLAAFGFISTKLLLNTVMPLVY